MLWPLRMHTGGVAGSRDPRVGRQEVADGGGSLQQFYQRTNSPGYRTQWALPGAPGTRGGSLSSPPLRLTSHRTFIKFALTGLSGVFVNLGSSLRNRQYPASRFIQTSNQVLRT